MLAHLKTGSIGIAGISGITGITGINGITDNLKNGKSPTDNFKSRDASASKNQFLGRIYTPGVRILC